MTNSSETKSGDRFSPTSLTRVWYHPVVVQIQTSHTIFGKYNWYNFYGKHLQIPKCSNPDSAFLLGIFQQRPAPVQIFLNVLFTTLFPMTVTWQMLSPVTLWLSQTHWKKSSSEKWRAQIWENLGSSVCPGLTSWHDSIFLLRSLSLAWSQVKTRYRSARLIRKPVELNWVQAL